MSIAPEAPPITDALVKDCLFLRGEDAERAWDYLLSPDNVEVTVACLSGMSTSVCNDLAIRRDDDDPEWRRRALGFKRAVDRRLPMAKALLRKHNRARSADEFRNARVVLRELAFAVLRHERLSTDADIKPEPHDVDLWRTLDQLCLPVGDDVLTLRNLTETVWFGERGPDGEGE